jgi:hypothetical protein
MKRILASIGLVAIGASSLYAQESADQTKPWSISGSLRGFYDDNYATQVSSLKEGSWGIDVSPSAKFKYAPALTDVTASYVYDMKWYEKPDVEDQSHQAQVTINHQFSERYSVRAGDMFVVAQEPDMMSGNGIISTPVRSKGSNIHNRGNFGFLTEVTPVFGVDVTYENNLYSYEEEARAAQLDRDEHLAGIDLRWKVLPSTVGVFGYRLGQDSYSNKIIGQDTLGNYVESSRRDSWSHYFFVGADEEFTKELKGSVRVGAQYFDYYHEDETQTSPYADASISYEYLPGSSVVVGVKNQHAATDVIGFDAGNPVLDSEVTVPYVSWTHKITAKLTGNVVAQFQRATFNGGSFDSQNEDYYTIGANLGYQINKYILAEAGYNFDDLESTVGRTYNRNRVYFGVRATY